MKREVPIDGIMICDGKVIYLQERTYFSPTVVNNEGGVRIMEVDPELTISPIRVESVRKKCLLESVAYAARRNSGKRCEELQEKNSR